MNILGLSAFYHDSAACLVRDGEIIAAAQEERFTRKKHDAAFPRNAVGYCLGEARVTIAEVEHLVEVGEETGRLDAMLLQLADIYDKDVRTSIKSLTSVFEPAIILVMGVIVGTVVLSMLMAIFSINEVGF